MNKFYIYYFNPYYDVAYQVFERSSENEEDTVIAEFLYRKDAVLFCKIKNKQCQN